MIDVVRDKDTGEVSLRLNHPPVQIPVMPQFIKPLELLRYLKESFSEEYRLVWYEPIKPKSAEGLVGVNGEALSNVGETA